MSYIVISDREVCGKSKGETITNKELQDAGVSAETLIAGNHIKATATIATNPSIKPANQEGATK